MATKILFAPKQPDNILDDRPRADAARLRAGRRSIPARRSSSRPPRTPSTTWAWRARWAASSSARRPKLKLVQLLSAGYDRVDIEAARKAKVPVSNNGGANAIAVAEHTLMLILAVLKRVVKFHNDVVAGKWRVGDPTDTRVYELARHARSASSASATSARRSRGARRPSTRRCSTTTSRRLTEHQEDALGVRFVALRPSCCGPPTSLSLHVPLDDSTREMIGATRAGADEARPRSSSTPAAGRSSTRTRSTTR